METELIIEHAGRKLPVMLDPEGTFHVLVDGDRISAGSYEELQKTVRKIKVKFELPFTQVSTTGVRNGTITGIHAVNGNLLVRWSNGETEQVYSYSSHGEMMPQLSSGELAQVTHLVAERARIVRELDAFTRSRKWASPKEAAKNAQAEAVKNADASR